MNIGKPDACDKIRGTLMYIHIHFIVQGFPYMEVIDNRTKAMFCKLVIIAKNGASKTFLSTSLTLISLNTFLLLAMKLVLITKLRFDLS
jgi:hypothetical protein